MNFGRLRNIITIEQESPNDAGDFGTARGEWSTVKTVYAEARTLSATEAEDEKQTVGSTSIEFRIRIPKDYTITNKMRIVFREKNYYVTGIQPSNIPDQMLVAAVAKDNE